MDVTRAVPTDVIPAVDDPTFATGYGGEPDDEVIVLGADPPRAYPVRILAYHEIVNDEVGGEPVAVTWCPLCRAAVVYRRTVDGRTLTFGVSGKLADDDLVMYDRETGSEWKQSLGECIAGDLLGRELTVRPAEMVSWEAFRRAYPDGVVLEPPGGTSEAASDDGTPAPIDYDRDPYGEYLAGEGFGLAAHRGEGSRPWDRDDLDPKAVVLGVEAGDEALGFPRGRVEAAGGVVRASVGARAVVVFATPEGMDAFDDPGFGFAPTDDRRRFAADGTTWDGATGRAGDGRRLNRVPARRLFAFAWQHDHGRDAFL